MKLAIIGAGPGGLYAALEAAKRNVSVDLYEKRRIGEGICCGECIFDFLDIMPQPGEGLLHGVHNVVLAGRRLYGIAIGRYRNLWMVDRKTWQQALARQATDRGVRLFEGADITPPRLLDMQREYDWIIDGSGAPSVASRAYHFTGEYFHEYMAACQVVLRGDFSSLHPRIKVGFFSDLPAALQPGYYWIFPKEKGLANAGVVCTVRKALGGKPPGLKKRLADMLDRENLRGCEILATGGGMSSARVLPRLVFDNLLLVGDAAGLTSPLHGGGIDTACLSGHLAASAIARGKRGVGGYEKRLHRHLRDKLALENITVQKMRTLDFNGFDELLAGVTSRSRAVRAGIALRHPDLLMAAYRLLRHKKHTLNGSVLQDA
ncbi:MAG: NAD(P)/FAD-dependent oxidoreductase [Deltaproteobacteria bacterium]|nr:NAD(P)/FAD-dependent oxidoreductase [Deltaproteobacteria bacterium]